MTTKRSAWVTTALLAGLLAACDRDPSPAGPTPVTTTPAAPSPSPLPTPTPAATPTPPPASNQPPTGQFRLTPEPVNGTVVLELGDTLRVDGTGFSGTNPGDELRLFAKWGDGTKDEVGCGRCRLAHAYTNTGTYDCTVEINDGVEDQARAAARVRKTFPVEVRSRTISGPSIGSFTSTPAAIEVGQSSTLVWTTSKAASCSLDQGVGTVTCNGNASVSPAATTTYRLTAEGSGRTATATATVTVRGPRIDSFTATPDTIDAAAGQSSTLAWTTVNATSCSIDNGVGSVPCGSGSTSVSPAADTTYRLRATGPTGTSTATARVTVQYCHVINAADGAGVSVACPTSAAQFCESVPIAGTSATHAEDACVACFGIGGGCTNIIGASGSFVAIGAGYFPGSAARASFFFASDCASAAEIADACTVVGRWAP